MDLDLKMDPVAEEYLAGLHPVATVVIVHIPIVSAVVAAIAHEVRQRREQRRLWEPAVMHPYIGSWPEKTAALND